MYIGYARVSTQDQNLALQHDALRQAGCHRICEDKISGAKAERPGLSEAIALMEPGDTLVIWKLSRLGRSVSELIATVQLLQQKGMELKSLQENIDTSTAIGKLLFHIIASFAQFERDNTVENTHAGLAAARARGRIGGRRRVVNEEVQAQARKLRATYPDEPASRLCLRLNISRASFYRALATASR